LNNGIVAMMAQNNDKTKLVKPRAKNSCFKYLIWETMLEISLQACNVNADSMIPMDVKVNTIEQQCKWFCCQKNLKFEVCQVVVGVFLR